MSSLSMAQLGYFGSTDAAAQSGATPPTTPPAPAPPPPAPPKVDPIGAYLRAKERMAALQASMSAFDTPGAPGPTINVVEPAPVQVRMERSNGDLAKLALGGIISGLAVWAMTRKK